MQKPDVAAARQIFQRAFGTAAGVADPDRYRADNGMVPSRWRCDPETALVAEDRGVILGSNFVTTWGSHGFFGPLTVDPAHWNKGVAARLLSATMPIFEDRRIASPALYTLASSPKHIELYRRFGFWPRFLTAITTRPAARYPDAPEVTLFSDLGDAKREAALQDLRALCGAQFAGLDPSGEVAALLDQGIGDTLILPDAMAVVHCGSGSEAGENRAFVKFAVAASASALRAILMAVLDHAARQGLIEVETGTNLARAESYEVLAGLGFRPRLFGVAMHHGNDPLYNRPGVFVLDDWR